MEFVRFEGQNCHLACVVNIANELKVDYKNAYYNLWSEIDFLDEKKFEIFTSKRVLKNLEECGISLFKVDDPVSIANEEFFVAGLDFFHIPWSIIYQNFHGYHYIIMQKKADGILCFDPTYNKKRIKVEIEAIIPHAFDIVRVVKNKPVTKSYSPKTDAIQIVNKCDEIRDKLFEDINNCAKNKKRFKPLISLVSAMTNNRHLFYEFLLKDESYKTLACQFNSLFPDWNAVRFGLMKVFVKNDSIGAAEDACETLSNVLKKEAFLARNIVDSGL